jgi:hypothetical protein
VKAIEIERRIELTRRNLRSLLAKLDGAPADSSRTIWKDGWFVTAVDDDEHYGDRPPGLMHPDTEERLMTGDF